MLTKTHACKAKKGADPPVGFSPLLPDTSPVTELSSRIKDADFGLPGSAFAIPNPAFTIHSHESRVRLIGRQWVLNELSSLRVKSSNFIPIRVCNINVAISFI